MDIVCQQTIYYGFTLGHKTLLWLHLAKSSTAAQCLVHRPTLGLSHTRGEAAERSERRGRGSSKQNFSLGSPRRISKGGGKTWCAGWGFCRGLSVNSCKPRLLAADNRSAHSAWPLMHGKSKKIEICLEKEGRGWEQSGGCRGETPTFSKLQTTRKLSSRHHV